MQIGRVSVDAPIPCFDLTAIEPHVKREILDRWEAILDSGAFVGGEYVSRFEEEFAIACGTAHAVAVSSGTDALRFILLALGLRAGDEVIVPANTFIATSEAVSQAGGRVVFVDVDSNSYNIDPASVADAITPRTKAIVPVHLYGQPADMAPILELAERHGLWVVEDASQAHLARYDGQLAGSIGVAAAFSFYPAKNLGACGEAGAVTTNDSAIAERVRQLRDHGQSRKHHHEFEGYNGRCDALQAAALSVKLRHLSRHNDTRRSVAERYLYYLRDAEHVVLPRVMERCRPVWHLFVVQIDRRDAVQKALTNCGVGTGLHYPVPLHLQMAYRHLGYRDGQLPIAESCARRVLTLPMYPELTDEQIRYVCDVLNEVTGTHAEILVNAEPKISV